MIPIWINNRNRLTSVRNMIEYLRQIPQALPIIVDNASTYPPLLEWYEHYDGKVIMLPRNLGPWAPWNACDDLSLGSTCYVETDADLDLSGVPIDVLSRLNEGLTKYPRLVKAGLSLENHDLPSWAEIGIDDNSNWEAQYWDHKTDDGWWIADTDTTFAMYRGEWHSREQCVRPAYRADRPYTARHIPWYRLMTDEERYYEAHADPQWATTARWWTQGRKE